jgi:hypothetical protein
MPISINLSVTTSELSRDTIRTVEPCGVLSRVNEFPFRVKMAFTINQDPHSQVVGRALSSGLVSLFYPQITQIAELCAVTWAYFADNRHDNRRLATQISGR